METTVSSTTNQAQMAADIIKKLYDQANTIISSANSVNLKPIDMGAMGKFPYNWHLNNDTNFNAATYDWINKNTIISGNNNLVSSQDLFTNLYLKVISAISFSYSTQDSKTLADAIVNSQAKSATLITEWKMTYGSVPQVKNGEQVIDAITEFILQNWTTQKGVTLKQVQDAIDTDALFDNLPATGATILPAFVDYVSSLGNAAGLIDTSSLSNGMIRRIKDALLSASPNNGGIVRTDNASTSPLVYSPAFDVTTRVEDIALGLKNTNANNTVNLNMVMSNFSDNTADVVVNNATYNGVDLGWLFDVGVGTDVNYYKETVVKSSSQITVSMQFTGVTLVEYGPTEFDLVNNKGWYDPTPILEAKKNGTNDVTGFKYSGGQDFTQFGFSTAVAIANYPTISVTIHSKDYDKLAKHFDAEQNYHVSSMCGGDTASGKVAYSKTDLTIDTANQSFTIKLGAPQGSTFETGLDARAFVMGIQTNFPIPK